MNKEMQKKVTRLTDQECFQWQCSKFDVCDNYFHLIKGYSGGDQLNTLCNYWDCVIRLVSLFLQIYFFVYINAKFHLINGFSFRLTENLRDYKRFQGLQT